MARAILKFDDRELAIGADEISFGRTAENAVAFPDNPNISRRHAAIRFADGRFVVEDLGSSNGTTINGQPLAGPTALGDGDFITLGNSVIVEFVLADDESADEADEAYAAAGAESAAAAADADGAGAKSKTGLVLGVTGAVCGLAIVFAVAAGVILLGGGAGGAGGCDAAARIVSPSHGETISQETDVRVEVKNSACVGAVHVLLNGREIASLTEEPYATQLDPKNYPDLADGGLYGLTVVIEDGRGNRLPAAREIALQFETKEIATPTPSATPTGTATPEIAQGRQPTLIDVQKMTAAIVGKFTGGSFRYNLSNPEFLAEVRKRSAEYAAAPGYFERAAPYKEIINQSFVRDRALDASLPYLLAMSRSRFTLEKTDAGEGLWRMTNDFAAANAYNVACASPNLADPAQECAAKAAALYMEDLVVKTFDGDIVYAVAAFGKTAQDANVWKATLPADRADFWKIVGDAAQREQIARFFAAAVVAENPQKFGLKTDRPISELYPPVIK